MKIKIKIKKRERKLPMRKPDILIWAQWFGLLDDIRKDN